MGWFKKSKDDNLLPTREPLPSLFSTDWDFTSNKAQRAQNLHEKLKITFQKGIENLHVVDSKGKITQSSKFAMDEQYQDLTTAKMLNSRIAGIPEAEISWYAGQGFIGWQTAAMLSQNWLIDKACTMPAKDCVRNGYEITANDGTEVNADVFQYIVKQDKKFGIKRNCVEFVRNGRIFGIRIALFEVVSTDKEYYEKPFNPDGIRPNSYKGISQIDPYWVAPELDAEAASNPASQHFYEPTWWRINGKRVHRTHLVIFRNGELPDILKPSYIYGGIPVPQKIAERVYAAERTANEAPMLAMSKRLTTYKIDMTQAAANQTAFEAKLALWSSYMNNYGIKAIGGEEEVQQFDTSLADLDAVIMTQYQLVAAASGVPATKLLGTSPKGFNATGEFEEASYHEELESIQENDLTALIDRHHLLLMRSHVAPKFKITPFETEINWNPVDSPTAGELADINLKKAQTDSSLADSGAIDGEDIRNRLIADKHSGYNGMEAEKSLDDEEEISE